MSPLSTVVHIREVHEETARVRTFVLDTALPQARPGQFVMLWLPGVNEKPVSIAYPDPLTLSVARVGPFSAALHALTEGGQVGVRGPFGNGFRLPADGEAGKVDEALLVGGGYGSAPLYFLARRLVEQGVPATVALGARSAGDLLYVERFRALGVDLLLSTDDGSEGRRGTVTAMLAQRLERGELGRPEVYACGPERMLVALLHLCQAHDLPGQFSVERYMKCGFGICGQCAMDDLLVCQDGPVFSVGQLARLRDFGHSRRDATGQRQGIG